MSNETLSNIIKAKEAMFNAISNASVISFDYDKSAEKFEEYYHTGDFNEVGTFNRMVAAVLKSDKDGYCMADTFDKIGRTYITLGVYPKWRALIVIE